MPPPSSPLSIYLHVPFCVHRCAYCDFNTYAGQEDSIPAYVDALIREIEFVGRSLRHCEEGGFPDEAISAPQRGLLREDRPRNDGTREGAHETGDLPITIHTIFFGGGTPSLLSASQLTSILDALRATFAFAPDLEATIEANPGTTSPEFLRHIREAGINRLSFGVQSANPDELRMLERAHNFFDVINSVKWARQAGFTNLNLDLIYALPEQTLLRWQNTVRRIVDLGPEHISMYALTLEHGTPFGRWSAKGLLPLPNPDLAADMYEWADEFLSANGYGQYEISNWAKNVERLTFNVQRSYECRHNLQYWRNLSYLGLGAGAHGFANGIRYSNVLRIKTYIERLNTEHWTLNTDFPLTPAVVNQRRLAAREQMQETMLTGLRLTREGVADATFRERFGMGIVEAFPREIEELLRLGLVEWRSHDGTDYATRNTYPLPPNSYPLSPIPHRALRLTRSARLVANQAFMRFVDG